ncbi:hypothetical protein BX600DRAFT_319871 [Xylariales sp. PMI_506]|nr:hypothetical protein BX600DRAFT_319871 [Xylariales sp. PMI_506]
MQEIQDMIRDMNDANRESQEQIKRKASSISNIGTAVTRLTAGTTGSRGECISFSYEIAQSTLVNDGQEIAQSRRASRRRTGPLSAAQREKAALIREARCLR